MRYARASTNLFEDGDQVDYALKLAGLNSTLGEPVVTADEIRTRALGWGTLTATIPAPTVAKRKKERYGVAAELHGEHYDFDR